MDTILNYPQINTKFKKIAVSEYQFRIENFITTHFSLYLFEPLNNEDLIQEVLNSLDPYLYCQSYFVLSEPYFNWIPQFLKKGAFDVIIGPLRPSEFYGKLEHFFSHEYQSNLLKNKTHKSLDLTKKEQKLFDFLIDHPKGVTRDQLMNKCWKNVSVHPKTLDVHLFNLRQKLETMGCQINFLNGSWQLYYSQLSLTSGAPAT